MIIKEHRFNLLVKTTGTRRRAELAVLASFAERKPDGCMFHLWKSNPTTKAKPDRKPIRIWVNLYAESPHLAYPSRPEAKMKGGFNATTIAVPFVEVVR